MDVTMRVDAGPALGFGHAMRCATLAGALTDRGHRVHVVTAELPESIRQRFVAAGATAQYTAEPVTSVVAAQGAVCLVDGYGLGEEIEHLAAAGVPLALVDDNHELPVGLARLVLNQNPHAADVDYPADSTRTDLLGLRYAMVRPDVRTVQRAPAARSPVLLVAMGGTDPNRVTREVVDALAGVDGVELVIAFGDSHPDADRLRADVAASSTKRRASGDLLAEFATIDLAVVAGGSILWELGFLGIPAVALCVADNQLAATQAAEEAGAVIGLDWRSGSRTDELVCLVEDLVADPVRRGEMGDAGRELIDGRGAERVVEALERLVG